VKYLVWFVYIKSPLGTVLRYSKQAVLGIFESPDEARAVIARLSDKLSAQLELVMVSDSESLYSISLLDPDLPDVIRSMRGKREQVFLILAVWR